MSLESRNARALGHDYPAGAEHDPSAPWNQSEPEECADCGGTGVLHGSECMPCGTCDGTGEEHQPTREEIAEAKADAAMDREKDEPRE